MSNENEGCQCARCRSENPGFDEEIGAIKKLVDGEPSGNDGDDLFRGVDCIESDEKFTWAHGPKTATFAHAVEPWYPKTR